MAKLSKIERESLKAFAKQKPLKRSIPAQVPMSQYLLYLSSLPESLTPPKPVRFQGNYWLL
jgi:hypothetical protein